MKPPWDEKLPGTVNKGQHKAFGSIGSRPKLWRVTIARFCMIIFFPFQRYTFYRIKINKTVEIIQMHNTIIRQRVIIQSNVII
jgi:hypothetical protein